MLDSPNVSDIVFQYSLTLSYSLYSSSTGRVVSLNNVSFFVSKGEVVSVVGLSGIGKSTLLNMLGLTSCKVFLDGIDIFSLNDFFNSQLTTVRNNKLGFIFQSYNLINRTTVLKNVESHRRYE